LKNTSHAFDEVLGWGHAIQPPDEWVTVAKNQYTRGRLWKFHGCFADQGLLYHWVKYVKKNVSIIVYNVLQNWVSSGAQQGNDTSNGSPVMETNASTYNISGFGCPNHYRIFPRNRPSPQKDFTHFTGTKKPWESKTIPADIESPEKAVWAQEIWFHLLRKANQEFDLNLNITTVLTKQKPLLGRFPGRRDIIDAALASRN
jgi:hypothetical protein